MWTCGYILDKINSVSIWEFDTPQTRITLLSVNADETREADQVTLKHQALLYGQKSFKHGDKKELVGQLCCGVRRQKSQ